MTPALKAMVEAMIAEWRRQGTLFEWEPGDTDPHRVNMTVGDAVDLEKVARAGLEAIARLGDFEDVAHAAASAEPFQTPDGERWTPGQIIASECWRAALDAILKDQP